MKIFELWKAVYPESKHDQEEWLTWWRWKYEKNPAGAGRIWLAEHDGKIVGQYGFIFMDIKVGDKVLKALQGADSMTHPNYRRQGINLTLIRHALDETGEAGFNIATAFPVHASTSYAIHIKSGWFHVGTMQLFFKPLNWNNVIKAKVKNKWLQRVLAVGGRLIFDKMLFKTHNPPTVQGLHINRVASFDDRINTLWAETSTRHMIMVVRNERYLNWRYSTARQNYTILVGEKANKILGYLVLRHQIVRSGIVVSHIFDLIAESEEVMHGLVSSAVENCRLNNADLVIYSLMAGKTYRRILKRSGFISVPFIKGLALAAYSSSSSIPKDFLSDPENWLVQIGDSDMK